MEYKKITHSQIKKEKRKKEGMKNRQDKQKTKRTMVDLKPNTLMITLNINGINILIRSQRLSYWIFFKAISNCMLSKEMYFIS